MQPHRPYGGPSRDEPDFVVEYHWAPDERLSQCKLMQGMRSDFIYADDERREVFMIWPELLDTSGQVIMDTAPDIAPLRGTANMWILNRDRRPLHAERIRIGTQGYWVVGGGKLAAVTVIRVGSLRELQD